MFPSLIKLSFFSFIFVWARLAIKMREHHFRKLRELFHPLEVKAQIHKYFWGRELQMKGQYTIQNQVLLWPLTRSSRNVIFFFLFFFYFFYFFFYLWWILSYIEMKQPRVYMCSHPNPPSHLPLHPFPLGFPSAPGPSTCLMHPTWAGDLFHPR